MIRSPKFLFVAWLAVLSSAFGSRAVLAQQGQPSNPAMEDWKPEKLVNVEILPKTMAPDDVIKLMKAFNASLNVDCVFCHKGQVGKPWSTYDFTDTSKKRHETARLMMRTVNDLNEKFKDLGDMDDPTKVTCATCHRRSRHPEIEPPAGPAKPEAKEPPAK